MAQDTGHAALLLGVVAAWAKCFDYRAYRPAKIKFVTINESIELKEILGRPAFQCRKLTGFEPARRLIRRPTMYPGAFPKRSRKTSIIYLGIGGRGADRGVIAVHVFRNGCFLNMQEITLDFLCGPETLIALLE